MSVCTPSVVSPGSVETSQHALCPSLRFSGWQAPCWSSYWGCWWFPLWAGGGWSDFLSPRASSSSSSSRWDVLLTCLSSHVCPHLLSSLVPFKKNVIWKKELEFQCSCFLSEIGWTSVSQIFTNSHSNVCLCLSLSVSLSLCVCVSQFIPESARYNVSAGNIQAAVETLQKIAKMNRASLPEGRLVEPPVVSSLWAQTRVLAISLISDIGLYVQYIYIYLILFFMLMLFDKSSLM